MIKLYRALQTVTLLIFIILAFSIYGCGGGGGGGSSIADTTPKEFNLYPDGFFTTGYQETYSLTGSDTVGGKYTSTNFLQTEASEIYKGEAVVPVKYLVEITNTVANVSNTAVVTDYFTEDANNRLYLGYDDSSASVSAVASSTEPIPQTAHIGDFGTIGTYDITDGETEIESWRLTDAGNGFANFIISYTDTDKSGNITGSGDETYLIDQNGNRISLSLRIYYADHDVTITVSGNKQ